MNYRFIVLVLIFFSLVSCSYTEKSVNSDYDEMCVFVADVMTMDISEQKKFDHIGKYLTERLKSNDMKEAYDLVYQISPDQRYQVFKGAVEESSGEAWNCKALEELFKLRD